MRKSLKLVAATIAVSASSMAINSAEAQVIGDNEASGTWTERSIVDVADSINKEIAETGKYTIQWGDTLSVIAEALGLSVEEVTVLNQLENPDLIIAGSTLAFNEEHHQVTFANEDLGEEVTYSTETGEEVEPVETEEVIEEVVEPEVTEPMTEDGLVLNTVEEWIAPETQEVEAAEEVSEFTYETAEVSYPENLVTWEEEVTEEVVAEETPVVEEEIIEESVVEEPVLEEETTEVVEETPVVEEIVEEEIVEEVEEPTYETDLNVFEETQPWEVVEEEEPVVEEPVVEEPASGSIDYYSASLGSMPENAGLSESELAAKLEIRRRESTHNYDIYSVSGNHYGAYQMLDSYFTTYGYGDRSPASQEAAANGYVASRYGSWQAALAHHNANNWY
ncbi:LysM peptidoglycan-binding domain-containing protein [Ruoffia sp. FAM 20857]|uniref:aggregation-promoting factor C-terminal-like domain-containing protein n=1 Tax=unclassified Ruoffia TaxID=2862149 RepID=UPI003888C4D6